MSSHCARNSKGKLNMLLTLCFQNDKQISLANTQPTYITKGMGFWGSARC